MRRTFSDIPRVARVLALAGLSLAPADGAAAQAGCPTGRLAGGQAADLWCMELLPAGPVSGARGAAYPCRRRCETSAGSAGC